MVTQVTQNYTPRRGDIIWMNFNPTRGHEQKGKRPALVLSSEPYNTKSGMMVTCPITSQDKKSPFGVFFENRTVSGFVITNQVTSVDWVERKVRFIDTASPSIVQEVVGKIELLIGDEKEVA
jgi:mRNA interferase MazF